MKQYLMVKNFGLSPQLCLPESISLLNLKLDLTNVAKGVSTVRLVSDGIMYFVD